MDTGIMQAYHMTIPRYIKRTKFYRKKMKLLLSSLVRDKDQSQEKDNDMAELNLKQIIDRLNAEFIGETRKLVFKYDTTRQNLPRIWRRWSRMRRSTISSRITSSIQYFSGAWIRPQLSDLCTVSETGCRTTI